MNVKEVVKVAITYVNDIFEAENLENIGLEEVVLNETEDTWDVTIGFSRPWDYLKTAPIIGLRPPEQYPRRQYKIIRVENNNGKVHSIKIRELTNA